MFDHYREADLGGASKAAFLEGSTDKCLDVDTSLMLADVYIWGFRYSYRQFGLYVDIFLYVTMRVNQMLSTKGKYVRI